MTSHQGAGVAAAATAAVSHMHLGDLDRRCRRHFQLPNDFRLGNCQVVVTAVIGAGVVVATQLTSAVRVLTIFTDYQLILIITI